MPPTLITSALFSFAAFLIYGYVGMQLSRRVLSSPPAQRAWNLFTLWWFCLAATTLIGGLLNLAGAFGITNLSLFIGMTYVNILLICLALLGLLYYLLYLFTGSSRSLVFLVLFYLVYFLLLVYYITTSDPLEVKVARWSASISYRTPPSAPFFNLLLVLLVFPQIIGALAYFTLYFRLRDPTQRYRIFLVSWSIIVWFFSAFAAAAAGLASQDWWQITSRLIGIAASIGIFLAYMPPNFLKRRLRVKSISDGSLLTHTEQSTDRS